MSLFDDLRAAGQKIDPQFQPNSNEVQATLAALIYHAEHGDEFLEAAHSDESDAMTRLLAPGTVEQDQQPAASSASAPPADTSPPAPVSDDELDRQIADLEQQRAARQATAQQTTVEHTTGETV